MNHWYCTNWQPLAKPDESGREKAERWLNQERGWNTKLTSELLADHAESIKREAVRETVETCCKIVQSHAEQVHDGDAGCSDIDEAIRSAFEKGE
jgi:hypothetical protein